METRVTSEQVDDILQDGSVIPVSLIDDICRDWLDMQARLGRAEAVVQLVEVCIELAEDSRTWFPERLIEAVEEYRATQPTEDRR